MIYSQGKLEDMKFRAYMLECIEYFTKTGRLELAREAGEISAQLKKKIETADYSKRDAWLEIENKFKTYVQGNS